MQSANQLFSKHMGSAEVLMVNRIATWGSHSKSFFVKKEQMKLHRILSLKIATMKRAVWAWILGEV